MGLRVGLDVFRDEKFSEWIWNEKVVVCDKGVAENSNILRCDALPLGEWFATLRGNTQVRTEYFQNFEFSELPFNVTAQ